MCSASRGSKTNRLLSPAGNSGPALCRGWNQHHVWTLLCLLEASQAESTVSHQAQSALSQQLPKVFRSDAAEVDNIRYCTPIVGNSSSGVLVQNLSESLPSLDVRSQNLGGDLSNELQKILK